MSYRYEIESGDEVHCQECKALRHARLMDFGYGPTEYWGSWSNHVDLQMVCDYCESDNICHPDEVEAEEAEMD